MSISNESNDPYTSTLLDTLMSSEHERLNTFIRWPDDVPVLPVAARSLSRAGFYVNREPNLGQTRCFSCGLVIDNWRGDDVPMDRHREARPDCAFVIREDEAVSDNRVEEVDNRIATVGQIEDDGVMVGNHEELAEDIPRELYQFEEVRLQSFLHWPIPDVVSPIALARAGFYSLNPNANSASDSVQCAFCEGAVGSWEHGDCPDREHRRHFPLCRFVLGTINPRLQRLEGRGADAGEIGRGLNVHVVNGEGMGNLQELGVHTHTAPRKPRFTSLIARLTSFTGWPPHLVQTPAVLAEAGFYYEHPGSTTNSSSNGTNSSQNNSVLSDDHVRCFHCDGGLKHWDPDDDPWTEHARWFPQCSYVLLVKGAEFVGAAADRGGAASAGDPHGERGRRHSTTTSTLPALPSTSSSNPASTIQPATAPAITDRELQAHLQAGPALEALNLGIVVERVKQAIKEKLERTGSGFSNGAALIEAALNLQRDEDLEARAASGGRGDEETAERGVSNAFFQMLKDVMDESTPVQIQSEETDESLVESPENARTSTTRNLNTKDTNQTTNNRGHNMTVLNSTKATNASTSTASNNEEVPAKDPSASASSTVKLSLEEENRLLKEARLCKICMDSEVGIVFLPCGHLATCVQCAPNLQACPVCRSSIRATVRTFLS